MRSSCCVMPLPPNPRIEPYSRVYVSGIIPPFVNHLTKAKESAGMIDVNELRKGVTFELDGNLYKVLDYSHNKTGRGNANIRVKARNLQTGANIERTFSPGQSVQDVRLDFHNVSYLYHDGDFYYFMDNETFEQPAIKADMLGEDALY